MAITLVEASKLNPGDVVRNAVIEMFARTSDLLRVMPFMAVPGGSYHYNQEGTLPGVAFRGVNEAYAESAGVVNPQVEVLRIAGGDLDVDKAILKMHGEGVRSSHEAMKIKALSLYLTKKFVKGDSTSDPREFDGLQNRITGSQIVEADASATDGGDPLSLASFDDGIDQCDDPTHLVMSKAMRRLLTAAARTTSVGGFINYTVDAFGRQVTQYNDLPILYADMDETGARILDFDEVASTGSTATATSIYCVSMGENMLVGLQNGIMDVEDLGEIDAKPVLRTRVDWLVGMAALHGRCASRIRGISNAAVVV
ncbi:MAG: hypothetical protein KJP02_06725 [Octadecabacter sp.]|nr:hypothetical protein [Octadecabacter sp.]